MGMIGEMGVARASVALTAAHRTSLYSLSQQDFNNPSAGQKVEASQTWTELVPR